MHSNWPKNTFKLSILRTETSKFSGKNELLYYEPMTYGNTMGDANIHQGRNKGNEKMFMDICRVITWQFVDCYIMYKHVVY